MEVTQQTETVDDRRSRIRDEDLKLPPVTSHRDTKRSLRCTVESCKWNRDHQCYLAIHPTPLAEDQWAVGTSSPLLHPAPRSSSLQISQYLFSCSGKRRELQEAHLTRMFRERKVHCVKEFGISGFVFLLTQNKTPPCQNPP